MIPAQIKEYLERRGVDVKTTIDPMIWQSIGGAFAATQEELENYRRYLKEGRKPR